MIFFTHYLVFVNFFTLKLCCRCILLFGYTGNEKRPQYFFVLCTLVRAMMGFGACLVYSGTVPLINKLYPEKSGILTSIAQAALG